jgi:hypothetical protein
MVGLCKRRRAALSTHCEFAHHRISHVQRKSALTGRTAASPKMVGGRLCAVRAGRGENVWLDRYDAAKVSKEPKLTYLEDCHSHTRCMEMRNHDDDNN